MLEGNLWLSLIGVVIATGVVLALAYLFTKHVAGGETVKRLANRNLTINFEVMDQIKLGKDQKIILMRASERYLLLSVTQQNVSLLAELTKEEGSRWEETLTQPPAGGLGAGGASFQQRLMDMMKRRKQG